MANSTAFPGLATVVAWARSLAAYVFLGVYLAVVGPPALLLTALTGRATHIFTLGIFGARTARRILGVHYTIEGAEHVRGDRPTVYCINHQSNVDVLAFEILYPLCPNLRVMYKAEMGRVPILGRAMRAAGFVPVERQHRERAIGAVDAAAARLMAGDSFLLAPEGTRSQTGNLLPFKKGGFVMAIKAQVPVVPIALVGTRDAMPKGRALVRPTQVTVRIGAPIDTRGLTFEDRDALATRVRDVLGRLLTM